MGRKRRDDATKGAARFAAARGKSAIDGRHRGRVRALTTAQVMLQRMYNARIEALVAKNCELTDAYSWLESELARREDVLKAIVAQSQEAQERWLRLYRLVAGMAIKFGTVERDPLTGEITKAELDLSQDVPPEDYLERTHLDVSQSFLVELTVRGAQKEDDDEQE